MSLPRLRGTRERYAELDDSSVVLIPAKPTSVLLPEHFCEPLSQLRYPVRLDFSHERFRLRSMQALSQLKDTALVDIDLSDNELRSISELNRFPALKSLVASRNALESGPGVALAVHRLTRLDLSGNQLTVVPTLKELPLLQILNLSRNLIRDGWEEIGRCQGLQALDVSENAFDWSAETGELRRAMAVLRGLKRLRVLNLSHTPAASQRGYRGWVVANARKLELLDDAPVTEAERMGEDDKNSALDDDASSVASSAVASSWLSGFSGVSSRSTQREKPEGGRYSSAAAPAALSTAPSAAAPGHTLAPTFGRDVELILRREGGLLPRLVQECTRHVQERTGGEAGRVPAGTALTAEGHPSAVLALRHAFEISPERGIAALRESVVPSGGSSGDDDESELRDGDVRASCSLLRAFLIELPQPLIPNELFLPLLETTKAWAPTVVEHRQHEERAVRLEEIMMPYLAESHRILLEHLLCFLVNAARPYWAETPDYRQHLARVWAPCILRAPARIMSKFQGRVVDVMGMCVLTLLEARAGPGAHYGARDGDHYGASAGEGSGGVGDGQGARRGVVDGSGDQR